MPTPLTSSAALSTAPAAELAAATPAASVAVSPPSPVAPEAAAQVAQALHGLDPFMPLLLALVLAAGLWRYLALRRRHLGQAALRASLGAATPAAPESNGPWGGLALLALAVFALCAWGVHGGPGHAAWQALDTAAEQGATLRMQQVSTAGLATLRALTDSGDVLFLALLSLAVTGLLAWRRRWLDLQVWVFFIVAQGLLIRVFKLTFERVRPENLHGLVLSGDSFPSGHAAGSLLAYTLLAALMTAALPRAQRVAWLVLAWGWALAIGVSRVVLAAHWASDVLAGWALGTASLCLALYALRRLRA
ncbi:hypothetical protein CCO03_18875 [Comamonas serinivorans]|uniref:Phosphatidic acid phosphatase type 2/haloperoxidase domain-containing protein n=1 Tax=Comamonas serinivorans TaxID=1082851 RepID=A0A1Y0ES16_9BURK|nr:phosphatase PAP2 family protein [Comamonas serinivorans]ARU06447.1 hypothetical protein CCO03_18875 [Comamonas serinivorans]